MIRPAVLALCACLPGTALAQEEALERVRLQKEWLTYLGYYDGPASPGETASYRAARMAFAADAMVDASDRAAFHQALKTTRDANVRARLRGCSRPSKGQAIACREPGVIDRP